jgi:hypothetical protein
MWRQDQLMLPVMDQLGVSSSWGTWKVEGAYFLIGDSHSCLSGCLFAAATWRLDCFYDRHTGQSTIDAPKLFIGLALSGLVAWYLYCYQGIWPTTAYGITGGVLLLEPTGGIEGFDLYILSGITGHHIASGIVALVCSWRILAIDVLANNLAVVSWTAVMLVAGTMWYGLAMAPAFFSLTRYPWDNGLVQTHLRTSWCILRRGYEILEAWSTLPLRLLFLRLYWTES